MPRDPLTLRWRDARVRSLAMALGIAAALLLPLSTVAARHASAARATTPRRVVGYVPAWERGKGYQPDQIDFRVVNTVAHFSVAPLPDGTLAPPTWGPFPDPALVTAAHAAGAAIVLVVGDDRPQTAQSFAAVVQPALRPAFVAAVVAAVAADGYDGVDLDWEFPQSAGQRDGLSALVAALRTALGPGRTLSLSLPASAFWGDWFDVGLLTPNVDWFGVMTYALSGPSWDEYADNNAALFSGRDGEASADAAVHYYRSRGVPPEKLLVGLPFFGQRFDSVAALHAPLTDAAGTTIAYPDVLALIAAGWTEQWDTAAEVPFLTAPAADGLVSLVSYDDPRSIAAKCAYVRSEALGGALIWYVGQDRVDGGQPLLTAAGACR
ncbi:MAG TPA: glycoside hydrolase family 18 protein [Dehalococcoidia bacterium]|nr:glycoside hydrolase family 18 protein [Dehalococcoidia bacterium]